MIPRSDHFDGKQFYNPWERRPAALFDLLRWRMTSKPRSWPTRLENKFQALPKTRVTGSDLHATFVGHATVLLQTEGLNILTDPIWSESASPFSWFKIPRIHPPGISFSHLPPIDIVLISHSHYDHLDLKTLEQLWTRDQPQIFAPLGIDRIAPHIPMKTLDWHQSVSVDNEVAIHLQPAQHWSKRGLWDTDKTLWGSFVIETPSGNIYFAGDTGYGPHFRQIQLKFGTFRLALLPIGAYEPRWFLRYAHMSPEDAIQAHLDLGEPPSMAIHFGTFQLSDESYEDPLLTLEESKKEKKISKDQFRALHIGEAWHQAHSSFSSNCN